MSENPADTKDKVAAGTKPEDPKSTTPNKNKKKNKAAKQPAPEQLDDDAIAKLLDKKFKELGMANEDDKELKKIKKKYRNLGKATAENIFPGLDDAAKLNKLVEAFNQLSEMNDFFEENAFILDKLQSQDKIERDIMQSELTKMLGVKGNLEKFAREVQKNNSQIKEVNKKFVEEETRRREEIVNNFETHLNELTVKLDEKRVDAGKETAENEKLKEEFKQKIEEYEKREKEFFAQVQELDSKNDDRTKGVLGNLKSIEERAKKAFEIKDAIQGIKKQETEDKLKIAIYSQRFGDLESTFRTTIEVLQKFKNELLRSGSRVKSLYQENKELKQKCDKVNNVTLDIIESKEEIKKKIEQSRKEKDALRDRCNALQAEITAKTKQIQELEQK